jgi:hypothetical protein
VTACHFGDAVVPDGVAGDIDRVGFIERQHESDNITGKGSNSGGPVPRRGRGDTDGATILGKRHRLPGRQAFSAAAEPFGADDRRKYTRRLAEQVPSRIVGFSACWS